MPISRGILKVRFCLAQGLSSRWNFLRTFPLWLFVKWAYTAFILDYSASAFLVGLFSFHIPAPMDTPDQQASMVQQLAVVVQRCAVLPVGFMVSRKTRPCAAMAVFQVTLQWEGGCVSEAAVRFTALLLEWRASIAASVVLHFLYSVLQFHALFTALRSCWSGGRASIPGRQSTSWAIS